VVVTLGALAVVGDMFNRRSEFKNAPAVAGVTTSKKTVAKADSRPTEVKPHETVTKKEDTKKTEPVPSFKDDLAYLLSRFGKADYRERCDGLSRAGVCLTYQEANVRAVLVDESDGKWRLLGFLSRAVSETMDRSGLVD
jgi:hypothetical protein